MPPYLSRLMRAITRSRANRRTAPSLSDVQQARQHMLQSLADCHDASALRLRARIHAAASHKDLWMLRSETYRVISLHHCQTIAVERIDQLMHVFGDRAQWSDSGRPS